MSNLNFPGVNRNALAMPWLSYVPFYSGRKRVHAPFGIPPTAQVVYCIPLGYPQGHFGPNRRKPLAEVCSYDYWGTAPA
jgi:nitroreductase